MGGFVSWTCYDIGNSDDILVEVGIFGVSSLEGNGFILYDGTYTGELAVYQREGLDHCWYWGDDGDYKFKITPDGTAAYYKFSHVPEGEGAEPNQIYKCKQR